MGHQNLFSNAENRQEVYQSLQRDFARDEKVSHSALTVAIALLAIALIQGPSDGWIWLIMGCGAMFVTLTFFIDNTNRNWTMHLIDWMGNPDRTDD